MNFTFALAQFELFVLILIRLASFVFAAPFFNMANVPNRVKIGFSFCLTIMVYSLFPDMSVEYNGMIEYAIIVVEEIIVGILLGAVSSFCVQIIMFAGKIIDMDIGISMAQLYDPTTRMQVGIMGNFYYYMMMLGIIGFVSDFFVIGFRIALPVFAAILMLNCVLAILAKVSPQMNMFVVGMQLKIFVGIFVILFTISMLPSVSNFILDEIEKMFAILVRGMS